MEYNVKIDKIASKDVSYDSSAQCLEIALEEYRHVTERSNKYDNKIYIMITFCGLFFAFIINLLDKLMNIHFPETTKQGIIFIICITFFIIIFFDFFTEDSISFKGKDGFITNRHRIKHTK